jgi:hypothetical protein
MSASRRASIWTALPLHIGERLLCLLEVLGELVAFALIGRIGLRESGPRERDRECERHRGRGNQYASGHETRPAV